MRVNPVNEKIQLGDKLHIFTTTRASAEKCLEGGLLILTAKTFLNIIPERDEDPTRSERSFIIPRRTEEVLEAEGEAKKEEDEDNNSMHLSSIQ